MKIITHPGFFHADELCAIALIKIVGIAISSIERREVKEEDLADPNTFVIDIGGQYNPDQLLFDHHQDGALEASNVLVLRYLLAIEKIDQVAYDFIYTKLFARVSKNDRGITRSAPYELSALVRNLNQSVEFEVALNIVVDLIKPLITNALNARNYQDTWERLPIQNGFYKVSTDDFIVPGWKSFAAKDGTKYLICPSARGGFNLISADSNRYPIPATKAQLFIHNNQFLAVYPSAQDAENDLNTFHKKHELTEQ